MKILLQNSEENFSAMAQIMCSTDPWITLQKSHEDCMNSLRGEGKEVYAIMEDDGSVCGVIVLQMSGTFKGYLQSICLSEKVRGKGYGHKAISFCEERIFSVSPNFFLCVSSFNTRAQKFYFSQGFEQVGRIPDFVLDGYDELLLRKSTGSFASFAKKNH